MNTVSRRAVIIGSAVFLIGLMVFAAVIRPSLEARAYTAALNRDSTPLKNCFLKLAATTQLPLYYAPDTPLDTKQDNIRAINSQLKTCRQQLARFDDTIRSLPAQPLAGYVAGYHDAKVNQHEALDVIGQSTDVMDQYQLLANFLSSYYEHIGSYLDYVGRLNAIDSSYISLDQQTAVAGGASDLHQRATAIRGLKAPAGFEITATRTADMLERAASGGEQLLTGYRQGSDLTINRAYGVLEQAIKDYDSDIINLPFDELTKSYIPKQVQNLPVKVENLLAAESE